MSQWTTEWPTKEGLYWFYGWVDEFCRKSEGPRLDVVKVLECGPPDKRWPAYACNGASMWKKDGGIGYFRTIDLPDLPDVLALPDVKSLKGK
ncbi:MAG: hypothetical protein WC341_15360 [Bacteroidales bacterium]|jgi:hypothetical protein